MSADPLLSRLARWLQANGLDHNHRLLVAWSGGLDSSVLVDLLDRHRRMGGPQLELIHIDHGLRPTSKNDAAFCTDEARRRGLALTVRRLRFEDPSTGQQAARQRRLATIADHALARHIEVVAFGHHGDDRIETLLLNLRRGTGLDGVANMPRWGSFAFSGAPLHAIRPLATTPRCELERYAGRHDVEYVIDPTNKSDRYTRNSIRHHVVPQLADSAQARRAIIDSIDHLSAERRAADHHAERLRRRAQLPFPGLRSHAFQRTILADAPQATVARLFQALEPSLDAPSLRSLCTAIGEAHHSAPLHLTLSRCVVTIVRDRVVLHHSEERGGRDVLQNRAHPIRIAPFESGHAPFFGCQVHWGQIASADDAHPGEDRWTAHFDVDGLARPLRIEGFFDGLRLSRQDDKRGCYHQKLTTLFSQHRIDADIRWRWPCLIDANNELVWTPGMPRGAAAISDSAEDQRWWIQVQPFDDSIKIFRSKRN